MEDLRIDVRELALRARKASEKMALSTAEQRNDALCAMARALRDNADSILAANSLDVEAARESGTKESLIDRLMLDRDRVCSMAAALEELIELPDPVGLVQQQRELYNGIELTRVSVPLGVVAVVYEARPNVTADAAGICLKSGNSAVLRGGSMAANSNRVIACILHEAAVASGLPEGCIELVDSTDRAATDELMQLHGVIDVLIPRGGAGLIRHCVECSKVPVIETGTGNCHVYVHETADLFMACDILVNAKCRRYGVCNAAETLLMDASIAQEFLSLAVPKLAEKEVLLHCDGRSSECIRSLSCVEQVRFESATDEDWGREYLAPELAVKCVSGVQEAIDHINRYGTKHSEAIVASCERAEGAEAVETFLNRVDAAAVYANASTAFTDGGQFGLGAEIGISTQKLHARGPFALEGLTSYKYVLRGSGQVRS